MKGQKHKARKHSKHDLDPFVRDLDGFEDYADEYEAYEYFDIDYSENWDYAVDASDHGRERRFRNNDDEYRGKKKKKKRGKKLSALDFN